MTRELGAWWKSKGLFVRIHLMIGAFFIFGLFGPGDDNRWINALTDIFYLWVFIAAVHLGLVVTWRILPKR